MIEPVLRRPTRSLKDKVAIVTGAGAAGDGIGNGRASAILFAEDGCSVVCVDLDLILAHRTVEMIQSEGKGNAIAIRADVTSAEDCQHIVRTTIEKYGRLDILLNCVGIGGAAGTAVDVDMEAFRKGFEVNVFSMVQMAKYAIPEMVKNDPSQGWRGSIVNMSSVAGIRGGTPHLLYPASKGTVVQMTKAMAYHHAGDLIRVNCVCPGMVYTPMMYAGGMTEEAREARRNRSLLKTEGNAWDVGTAVRFLAGDEARWITGHDLVVDAGATCAVGTDIPKSASVNG
jgi:NAD(P)-dependent dehydrogenase (short-subunit alcohol dehydrogenase family)